MKYASVATGCLQGKAIRFPNGKIPKLGQADLICQKENSYNGRSFLFYEGKFFSWNIRSDFPKGNSKVGQYMMQNTSEQNTLAPGSPPSCCSSRRHSWCGRIKRPRSKTGRWTRWARSTLRTASTSREGQSLPSSRTPHCPPLARSARRWTPVEHHVVVFFLRNFRNDWNCRIAQ